MLPSACFSGLGSLLPDQAVVTTTTTACLLSYSSMIATIWGHGSVTPVRAGFESTVLPFGNQQPPSSGAPLIIHTAYGHVGHDTKNAMVQFPQHGPTEDDEVCESAVLTVAEAASLFKDMERRWAMRPRAHSTLATCPSSFGS